MENRLSNPGQSELFIMIGRITTIVCNNEWSSVGNRGWVFQISRVV